ncbi:hypothetical protein, partial [Companilactobacillus sp.]|uniref:hypothetical protein n=1 Tax=Companilactobacillus sp. TaxID=2767905 RepID=UPI00262508B6
GYHIEFVNGIRYDTQMCVRIITESGITLVASTTTPITTYNGVVVDILKSKGVYVPVLDKGSFRWERIVKIEDVGMKEVALVSVSDGTFAASEHDNGRYIFTHNAKQ